MTIRRGPGAKCRYGGVLREAISTWASLHSWINRLWIQVVPQTWMTRQPSMLCSQTSLAAPRRPCSFQAAAANRRDFNDTPPGLAQFGWSRQIRNLIHCVARLKRSPRFSSPGVWFVRGRLATVGKLSAKEVAVKAAKQLFGFTSLRALRHRTYRAAGTFGPLSKNVP